MDRNTKDILDSLDFIKQKLDELPTKDEIATKDDVRAIIREEVPGIVALEVKDIREDLKEIGRRLDALDEHHKNLKGVTKEIDDIRERVRDIEKHLGIERKIAA